MIELAKNSYYSIKVNQNKNRVYIRLSGIWDNQPEINEYLEDVKKYLQLVKPGFSVVSDIRELRETSITSMQVQLQAYKLNVEAGINQLAELHRLNDPVSERAIALAHKSQISLNIFEHQNDADAWLDELG